MKLYTFRTVRLSIVRSLFTVHSAMVYVIQVCRQLSSRSVCASVKFSFVSSLTLLHQPPAYFLLNSMRWTRKLLRMLSAEVFIADLIACSTCFGHHYAHQLRVMCQVCRMLHHPANRTHNPQLHTRPAT